MGILAKPIPTDNIRGAVIAYGSKLVDSTTAEAKKALTPNTYERWAPAAGAFEVKFQIGGTSDINYAAIAAADLVGETVQVLTAETEGGAQTSAGYFVFTDNLPQIVKFESRTVAEVIISGTFTRQVELGVFYAGELLQMPRNIYGGHSPIGLSQKTSYQSAMSDSGQFLGRTIIRKGTAASYQWQYLEPVFYREEFQKFVQSATRFPFFIQWRPVEFPEEVSYVHTTGDIKPQNMTGGHGLMSVSMNVVGHNDF